MPFPYRDGSREIASINIHYIQLQLRDGAESGSMMTGRSEPAQGGTMRYRRLAAMGFPAIAGETGGQARHGPVAYDLRDNRGRVDRQAQCVAADNAADGAVQLRWVIAIDQRQV